MPSSPAGARAVDEPTGEPDVLAFGPKRPDRRLLRALLVGAVVLLVALTAVGVWRLLPSPPRDFTAEDLSGVYAGMVRSDGLNEVSQLNRSNSYPSRLTVTPPECSALFAQTEGNAFPEAALDGVSTYWLNERSASISLITYRYADSETAKREYERISGALTACTSTAVTLNRKAVRLEQLAPTIGKGSPPQLVYLSQAAGEEARFATQVFQLSNTITWQYRYHYGRGGYDPTGSQQLTDSLLTQMRAVQAMHS